MTVHAFVDESKRSQRYLMAAAIVRPARLDPTRRARRALLLPGQRELHFHNEKEPRQRMLADTIARLPIEVHIYTTSAASRNDEPSREACVRRLAEDLADRHAQRLVIDSRQERDKLDKRTIRTVLLHSTTPTVPTWCMNTSRVRRNACSGSPMRQAGATAPVGSGAAASIP